MARQTILPAGAPRPVSYYSHGIRVGPVLYSAGQTARNAEGELVGIADARQQAERAFTNLSLVLGEANMTATDVVRLNILIRATSDLPAILAVKQQFFGNHNPTLTVAAVTSLAYPEYLLEVEAFAVRAGT